MQKFSAGREPKPKAFLKIKNNLFKAIKESKNTTPKFIDAINRNLIEDKVFATIRIKDIRGKGFSFNKAIRNGELLFEIVHIGISAIDGENPIAEVWKGIATATFSDVERDPSLTNKQKRLERSLKRRLSIVEKKLKKVLGRVNIQ